MNVGAYFYPGDAFEGQSEIHLALEYGIQEGIVTAEQIPEAPRYHYREEIEAYEFRQQVHRILIDAGVIASYREAQRIRAWTANCPWWCGGGHEQQVTEDRVEHSNPLAEVRLTTGGARVRVSTWEERDGASDEPMLVVTGFDDDNRLPPADYQKMGEAFIEAAKLFTHILASSISGLPR